MSDLTAENNIKSKIIRPRHFHSSVLAFFGNKFSKVDAKELTGIIQGDKVQIRIPEYKEGGSIAALPTMATVGSTMRRFEPEYDIAEPEDFTVDSYRVERNKELNVVLTWTFPTKINRIDLRHFDIDGFEIQWSVDDTTVTVVSTDPYVEIGDTSRSIALTITDGLFMNARIRAFTTLGLSSDVDELRVYSDWVDLDSELDRSGSSSWDFSFKESEVSYKNGDSQSMGAPIILLNDTDGAFDFTLASLASWKGYTFTFIRWGSNPGVSINIVPTVTEQIDGGGGGVGVPIVSYQHRALYSSTAAGMWLTRAST